MGLEELSEEGVVKEDNGKPKLGVLKYPLIAGGIYFIGLTIYETLDSLDRVYNYVFS